MIPIKKLVSYQRRARRRTPRDAKDAEGRLLRIVTYEAFVSSESL